MKKRKRNIGQEMIDGLLELRDALANGSPFPGKVSIRYCPPRRIKSRTRKK
jgi:hypothetical protein